MARWKDRRRRTETLQREAGEGIQKDWKPRRNQQHSDQAKRGSSQQRCCNMPSANPPRHITGNDSRSNNKEYCRTKNGEYSPHSGNSPYPLVGNWFLLVVGETSPL